VAIAMILPFAGESMIDIASRQGLIGDEQLDSFHETTIELLPEHSRFFASVVTFEAGGVFNLPH
jgi:hypothetical protein